MRLSHWDFRPKKRRKYVAAGSVEDRSAPPRKRPTLRILLLAAFGVLVYLKYDSFIHSPLAQSLRHPEALWQKTVARFKAPAAPQAASAHAGTSDSASLSLSCASPWQDSCLDAWTALESGERGRLRALLWKARLHGMIPESVSFSVAFRRNSGATQDSTSIDPDAQDPYHADAGGTWRLENVKLTADGRALTLAVMADGEGAETLCARTDGAPADAPALCPDEPGPRSPLRHSLPPRLAQERPPVVFFLPALREPIHPVLPGKVLDIPSAEGGWLKLHHGGTLFSYYSGFKGFHHGLRAGALVGPEDTLGFAGSADSAMAAAEGIIVAGSSGALDGALAGLRLRIEKNGSPVDPMAFLGLDADTAKVAHGP